MDYSLSMLWIGHSTEYLGKLSAMKMAMSIYGTICVLGLSRIHAQFGVNFEGSNIAGVQKMTKK